MPHMLGYILIPLVTLIVAVGGSFLTDAGMPWYDALTLPPWTPDGSVIGIVWTVIYILATVSALLVWHRHRNHRRLPVIMAAFALNATLNLLWSAVFFRWHLIGLAAVEAGILGCSVLLLIVLIWPLSRLAPALLVPYALWVSFATYLNASIWLLNR